jgi:nitroreductase
MSEYLNDTLKTIHNRKSVRNFTGEPIKEELLLELVKAGMAAPTAINCQPWEFIIINDNVTMGNFASSLQFSKMLDYASAAIVVCTNPEKANGKQMDYGILDAACASENILLAAESLGLGGAWVALYPKNIAMDYIRKELGIPQNIIPLNIIPLGVPSGKDYPKYKFNPEVIHYEKW